MWSQSEEDLVAMGADRLRGMQKPKARILLDSKRDREPQRCSELVSMMVSIF